MITGKLRTLMLTAVSAGILLTVPAFGADLGIAPTELQALEKTADTPAEHATIAKHYRLRAEALEAKAAEHERNVQRYSQAAGAIAQKWPAMAPRNIQKEKDLALEARRAARESRELAQHHIGRSVEALADNMSQRPADVRP